MSARTALLARVAAEHRAWVEEHGDQVPAVPADSDPHDGETSDYAEHHADRSAPAVVDDLLSSRLQAVLAGGNGDAMTTEADLPVDDAGDVVLAEGWVPPVMIRDLTEAGSDRKLRKYWVSGPGAAKINWKSDGDFTRCVAQLGKHVTDPEGLCAEYHKAATGKWPAEK